MRLKREFVSLETVFNEPRIILGSDLGLKCLSQYLSKRYQSHNHYSENISNIFSILN